MADVLVAVDDAADRTGLLEWFRAHTEHAVTAFDSTARPDRHRLCIGDREGLEPCWERLETDSKPPPFVVAVTGSSGQWHPPDRVDQILAGPVPSLLETPGGTARLERAVETGLEACRRSQALDYLQHGSRIDEPRGTEKVLATMSNAYFLTDTDGTIEYVNPAFEDLTGYDAREVLGETPAVLKSGKHDDAYYTDLWETLEAGETWEGDVVNRRKDGSLYHAEQTIVPIRDRNGELTRYAAIHVDITERENRTRQLRVLDRILRHNLSNDINVISGRAELIRREGTGEVSQRANEIVGKSDELAEIADKQRSIVQTLLEDQSLQRVDLVSATRSVVGRLRTSYPDAEFRVSTPQSAHASVLPAFEDAIEELVENAAKHSGGQPTVEVTVAAHDSVVEIRVTDNGPGIPESETDILTEGKEIEPLFHGKGLGLWLVYWLVYFSNGTISFDEGTSRGSVVSIELDEAVSDRAHRHHLSLNGRPQPWHT